jgi:hypothetical protein
MPHLLEPLQKCASHCVHSAKSSEKNAARTRIRSGPKNNSVLSINHTLKELIAKRVKAQIGGQINECFTHIHYLNFVL